MRTILAGAGLLLLAACQSTTAPKGLDPTVQITNNAGAVPLVMAWFDKSGQVAISSVAIGQTQCTRFITTLPTDSVRFVAYMGDTLAGNTALWSKQWSPWFNPATGIPSAGVVTGYPNGAEFWSVSSVAGTQFLMKPMAAAPC